MANMIDGDEYTRRELVANHRDALRRGELVATGIGFDDDVPDRSHAAINAKYERGEIRIVTESGRYPLGTVATMLDTDQYKLDPDYQRRHRWSVEQKSRLIESFIMNVPVPPIFLYEWDYSRYEVMDGLQRMTAVREFYNNVFALEGLQYWGELEGMRYQDLPFRIKEGVDRRYISSIILLKETSHGEDDPQRLKRFVFGRINTGGVQLTPQELRNALYDGPMNQLCKELSRYPALRTLWSIPQNVEELVEHPELAYDQPDMLDLDIEPLTSTRDDVVPEEYRTMADVELVLRFFANRQRMLVPDKLTLRDYFDRYLKAANLYDEALLSSLRDLYTSTLDLVLEIFDTLAFRRNRNGRWNADPSIAIYDALTSVVSRMLPYSDQLLDRRAEIVGGLENFYRENSAKFNLRGQTRPDLMDREILFETYLRSFLRSH